MYRETSGTAGAQHAFVGTSRGLVSSAPWCPFVIFTCNAAGTGRLFGRFWGNRERGAFPAAC